MDKTGQDLRASRRTFLKKVSSGSAAAFLVGPAASERPAQAAMYHQEYGDASGTRDPFVGIQVGAVSFVDEGIERVLDTLEERARVNALMLAVFTYGRGIAGRQIPDQPLPDHGAQKYDTDTFHGGSYASVHREYYDKVILRDFRAPDLGDFDLLASVVPKAKERRIRSYCWFEDVYNPRLLANFEQLAELDVHGNRNSQACLNNPEVRRFLTSLVEDWIKSYEVDGVMWGSERQGPLNNLIGSHHGSFSGHASVTCFCPYCERKGRDHGISIDRAREGYRRLERWVEATTRDPRPSDGYFVTWWRLLLEYPEILAWEKLWTDSLYEVYGEIYGTVKAIDHDLQVGWHIWHNNSFSPFYRAEQDYERLNGNADFLKIVMYNNCAGPRLSEYIRNMHSTIFRDSSPDQILAWHYAVLGYGGEASLEKLPTAGLSADYVARETRRAVAGVRNRIAVYPGIDIDVPTGAGEKKTQPSDVKAAVKAALTSGAQGVILSRKYSEMRLANLSGAGEALKEIASRTGR